LQDEFFLGGDGQKQRQGIIYDAEQSKNGLNVREQIEAKIGI
jgi:hypothetical protein